MENKDDLFKVKKRVLLENLVKRGILTDKRLFKAFAELALEDFIPNQYLEPLKIYEDIPNLFYFQNPDNYRTISAPHMISIMLQGLSLEKKDDLLILGAKSGYIAALAHKLAPEGKIVILEANSEIAKLTMENLENLGLDHNISVIVKNPLEGMKEETPWKKILVTGAITQERIFPLLRQLDKKEGVLYAPIGEDFVQTYTQILRINDEFFGKKQLQVRFTPLMTQVELDELELITDFDEIEIQDNPNKVDETLSKIDDKYKNISIKYTNKILDNLEIQPIVIKKEPQREEDRDYALDILESIEDFITDLKREEDIDELFNFLDNIEYNLNELKEFEEKYNIDLDKMKEYVNQIRTYCIIRKDLEKNKEKIEKKIEVINKQMEFINKFQDLIQGEMERLY